MITEIARFEGALPVRSIDPAAITHSNWGNRHASSFDCAEYFALKEEIRSSGGNVQPIKVRPIGSGARVGTSSGRSAARARGSTFELTGKSG